MTDPLGRYPGVACPTCRQAALETTSEAIQCRSCQARYELLDGRFPNLLPADANVSQAEIAVQDSVAEHYEQDRYANPWSTRYHAWWTDLMVSAVNVDGRILDNGCGIGALYDRLPEADITGLDISQEMLRLAATKSDQVLLGDGQQLPFADGTFDTVFARSLIHHLPDPGRGVADMARVLRSGGELVSVDTNRSLLSTLPRLLFQRGEHFSEEHKNFDRRELLALFEPHLEVERVHFFGYVAYPVVGFPDIADLFRFFPVKKLSYRLLMGVDAVLARIPLVRTQSFGVLIKARKLG